MIGVSSYLIRVHLNARTITSFFFLSSPYILLRAVFQVTRPRPKIFSFSKGQLVQPPQDTTTVGRCFGLVLRNEDLADIYSLYFLCHYRCPNKDSKSKYVFCTKDTQRMLSNNCNWSRLSFKSDKSNFHTKLTTRT